MKKFIIIFCLFMLICLIFYNVSNADMGPKPSITVHLKNLKSDDYGIDLLVYHEDAEKYIFTDENYELSNNITNNLYKYNEDGYIAESLRNTLLWKRRLNELDKGADKDTWTFNYFGVPSSFKVIIAYSDGTIDVTKKINRNAFNYEITVDANNMKVTENLKSTANNIYYGVIIATILVELFLSLFIIKKKVLNIIIIIITNVVTNISLQIFIMFFYQLDIIPYIILFLIAEIIVILVERFIYLKFIKDTIENNIKAYVIIANLTSALFSFAGLGAQYMI